MAPIRLLLTLALGCSAQDPTLIPRVIPPHLSEVHHRFFELQDFNKLKHFGASLKTTVKAEMLDRMELLIEWNHAPAIELHPQDWIGLFVTKLDEQFHAPVKFQYVFPLKPPTPLQNYGSMNFTVKNLRSSYVFIYISGNQQYPNIVAQSDPVTFSSVSHPQMPHIALSPLDPSKMLVMWTQQDQQKSQSPVLKWGLTPEKLVNTVVPSSDTYSKEDFCDRETSPAGRQGWFEPGRFFTAEVPIEAGKTYYYNCGDEVDGWFPTTINFTAPPAVGSNSTRLILLADMGNAPSDGSLQHSWDFYNHGELPSRNTTRLAQHILNKNDAHGVVHFGDVAYSVGFLSEWDEFMMQIEPVASRIPWMASIGNHEMGWSESDPFNGTLRTGTDSGGECGVAFLKRFPFASQPQMADVPTHMASPWYSFDIGSVHFTMLSSEHDFKKGSPQWLWMVDDLSRVDRSKTPWLAVTSHRAMYIASTYDGDMSVAELLRTNLEEQLLKYGVDFFFAGHHHSYQRFCKLNNGTCVGEESRQHGIYHFVMGMAGYDHSPVAKTGFPEAQFTDDTKWGATYWEFSQTSATMKFIDGATEEVVDSATFRKLPEAPRVALVV